METSQILERERRWAKPVAALSFLSVILFIAAIVVLAQKFGGDNDAEALRKIDPDSGLYIFGFVLRALGTALLAAPIVYLFQAAAARNSGILRQLIGLAVVGPLFLAIGTVIHGFSVTDAASDFVSMGPISGGPEHAKEVASNVLDDRSLLGVEQAFGIAGALAFAVSMAYASFQAMRVGLLTRFWGSLGAAIGAASIFMGLILVIHYTIYLGLLIGGYTPSGRPPAWAAGEAIPWPTPGERAAESLRGEDGAIEGHGTELGEADEIGTTGDPEAEKPRKRKRRRS